MHLLFTAAPRGRDRDGAAGRLRAQHKDGRYTHTHTYIYRRFIYKEHTSTHAHGTDPGVAWELKGSSLGYI